MNPIRFGALATLLTLAAGPVGGCSDDNTDTDDAGLSEDTISDAEANDAVDTNEPRCAEFWTWNEWSMGWAELNHRISYYQVRFEDPDAACDSESADIAFIGGDFTSGEVSTDLAEFEGRAQRIELDPEVAGATRLRVSTTTEPPGEVAGTATVDLVAEGLDRFDHFVVWIDGFSFITDVEQSNDYPTDYEPRLGWTSRGLGAAVEPPTRQGDTLSIPWMLRFEPGVSDDYTLRIDMNEAVPYARVGAELDIVVLGLTADVPRTTIESEHSIQMEEAFANTDEFEPYAPLEERTVVATGTPGAGEGFFGVSAFDIVMHPDTSCVSDRECDSVDTCGDDGFCDETTGVQGYYVRRLGAGARLNAYDDATGEATFEMRGYASTSSQILAFRPLRYTASQRVEWIQLDSVSATAQPDAEWTFGENPVSLAE